jgi:hypothetical protein
LTNWREFGLKNSRQSVARFAPKDIVNDREMPTMNHPLRVSRCLLFVLGGIFCLHSEVAVAQNVIRGTTPGWPGNTGYYAPQNVYQFAPNGTAPAVQVQYAPQPGYSAYYAPAAATRMAYAVPAAGSYQLSYTGANQPGLGTTAYYGGFSPPVQRVAYYAPQQVYYRPVAVAAPVQYYRPVIAYQPAPGAVAVAPQTCGYASSCQSSCGSSWSPWRPFAWLFGGSCSSSSCCKPACGQQGCGQVAVPYYTAPVIPTAPAPVPGAVIPSSPFRNPIVSPGTIAPPPTRSPGSVITSEPANTAPRLGPGTFTPVTPGTTAPPPPFNSTPLGPGGFSPTDPNRDNFRPTFSDPYSQPAPTNADTPIMLQPPPAATTPINPSGFRSTTDRTNLQLPLQSPSTISEPGLSNPPPSVQPLRDPHGEERNRNRAPQLLAPGDRTAAAGTRWAVIPAVWPVKTSGSPANKVQPTLEFAPVEPTSQLDDSGWKSAR